MSKTVWVNEGVGEDNPTEVEIPSGQTIGEFRRIYARKFGVSSDNVEVSTSTKTLRNDKTKLTELVKDKDTLYVVPRAKAGNF